MQGVDDGLGDPDVGYDYDGLVEAMEEGVGLGGGSDDDDADDVSNADEEEEEEEGADASGSGEEEEEGGSEQEEGPSDDEEAEEGDGEGVSELEDSGSDDEEEYVMAEPQVLLAHAGGKVAGGRKGGKRAGTMADDAGALGAFSCCLFMGAICGWTIHAPAVWRSRCSVFSVVLSRQAGFGFLCNAFTSTSLMNPLH